MAEKEYESNFNPHSREGSDNADISAVDDIAISIHTPAKGVTRDQLSGVGQNIYFNPHSREGSD